VAYQLTCFCTSGAKAHAIYNVVQTCFEQLQQVFTSGAFTTNSFRKVIAELTLEYAIDTADFLLFTQLDTVVGQTTLTGAVLTRRGIQFALGIQCTTRALQEKVGAFTTSELTFGPI
jgi:hypothetical protein